MSTASLTQTTPSYTPVCLGDKLVLTCTTSASIVSWRGISGNWRSISNTFKQVFDSFNLTATQVGATLVITATNESIPIELNGTTVSCSDNYGITFESLTLSVSSKICHK